MHSTPEPAPVNATPLTLAGMPRAAAGLDLGFLLLVALFPTVATMLFAPRDPLLDNEQVAQRLLVLQKMVEMVVVCGLLLYLVKRNRVPPTAFGVRWTNPGDQALGGVLTLVAAYGWMAASTLLLVTLLPIRQEEMLKRVEFIEQLPVNDIWLTLQLMSAVAIHEEVLFRGLMLPYLRRLLGNWPAAIVVSSLVFGSLHFHQGALAIFQITGLGVVLSCAFVLTRSLLVVVLAHLAFNTLQLQLVRLLPYLERVMESQLSGGGTP